MLPNLINNYTNVQNHFLDFIAPFIEDCTLRVCLYVFRRTQGFNKTLDYITMSQLEKGIVKRDGTRLDHGTGLSKNSILKGLKEAKEKDILLQLLVGREGDQKRIILLNTPENQKLIKLYEDDLVDYTHFLESEPVKNLHGGGANNEPGGVQIMNGGGANNEPTTTSVQKQVKKKKQQEVVESNDSEGKISRLDIINCLLALGVSESVTYSLVGSYNLREIEDQVKWLPARNPRDKAKTIVVAIKGKWSEPVSVVADDYAEDTIAIARQSVNSLAYKKSRVVVDDVTYRIKGVAPNFPILTCYLPDSNKTIDFNLEQLKQAELV